MPPTLVIADAPTKVYPGGVVVLRASDWMGPARATLSSVSDSRAITGGAVRDTQTVAVSIFSNPIGAFQAAADTLVIDFASVPLEVGMTYRVWFSVLIEGDWDETNSDTFLSATNFEHSYGCQLGWYGDSTFNLSDSDFATIFHLPRGRGHYAIHAAGTAGDVVGNEILHVRAYSRPGATLQWLVDQIFFVPFVFDGSVHAGEWRSGDFAIVGGQHQVAGATLEMTDGADGGDASGKFTFHPYPDETEVAQSGSDGGGDYQRKASYSAAEYMARVIPDDSYYLVNTQPAPDVEALAHMYSVHGANYRAAETILSDTFSRTVTPPAGGEDWGLSPEGFNYPSFNNTVQTTYVDGSEGVIETTDTVGGAPVFLRRWTAGHSGTLGANLDLQSFEWSGKMRIAEPVDIGSPPPEFKAFVMIGLASIPADRGWVIIFDVPARTWQMELTQERAPGGPGAYLFVGPVDISSWFAALSSIGFRIRKERYRLRVRVWDATGAEPGTWDFDGFIPISTNLSGSLGVGFSNVRTYPYGDDFIDAHNLVAQGNVFPFVKMSMSNTFTGWKTFWDDFVITYDPLGSSASMSAAIEQPEGTKIGEVAIPFGAYQMVYWGTRDWTGLLAGSPAYLEFSARAWNATGVAELQRAEAVLWYARSQHLPNVVSMNWRSGKREAGSKRMLKG